MKERIIITATTSAELVEKKGSETKRNSLIGVVLPLIVPICVLIYMSVEEIKFKYMDGSLKALFWGGLILSAVLFVLHKKAVQIENDKVTVAERSATGQSLIVTDQRIYGNIDRREFSYDYSKIIKAYSTQIAGNQAKLIVKLRDDSNLEFQYIKNINTVISCINDAKRNLDTATLVPAYQNNDQEQCQQNFSHDAELHLGNQVDSQNASIDRHTQDQNKEGIPERPQYPATDGKTTEGEIDLYDVVVTCAKGSITQIKAIREITLLELAPAKAVFTSLPYTIAESQEITAATNLKSKLEQTGMQVDLVKISSNM